MTDDLSPGQLAVYTIGHSNHPPEKLLSLLQTHGIEVLVDTRSHPGSKWAPHTTRTGLQELLHAAQITYLYMGDTLGGRPTDPECYDPQSKKPDYQIIQQKAFFRAGLARLIAGLRNYTVCIMCSEEDPAQCHRTLLIGDALRKQGITLRHIRGSGILQSGELVTEIEQPAFLQLPLLLGD